MSPGGDYDDLIGLIYDAPFDHSRWVTVMDRVSDQIGCHTASLTQLDIVTGEGSGMTSRTEDDTMSNYLLHWATRNPLLMVDDPVAYMRDWRPKIVRAEEWMDEDRLRGTSYFNEFLRPLGAEQSIIVRLGLSGRRVTTINIARPDRRGRIENHEIGTISRIQPHLVRAMKTTLTLSLAQQALDQLDATLQHSDKVMLFIDRAGLIRHRGAAAEAMLTAGRLLRLDGLRLHAAAPLVDEQLQRLIASDAGGAMPLPDVTGARGHMLSLTPLGPRAVAMFSAEPLRLLTVTAADTLPSIEERFGLTGAEGRVARSLLAGLTLKQAAARQSVSTSTVRVQLATIFSKVGVHRQTELVRLLLEAGYRGHA